MYINYLRHSIIIGLITSIIIYTILYFRQKNENELTDEELKKQKTNNLIIPLLSGVMTWFVVGSYYDMNNIGEPEFNFQLQQGGKYNSEINNIDELNKIDKMLSNGPAISEVAKGNILYDYNIGAEDFDQDELCKLLEVNYL